MSDLQAQINQRIESFVNEIAELARRQALETLAEALGGRRAGRGRASSGAAGRSARARAKGEKRPKAEIAATAEQLAGAVTGEPGRRIEELGRALGIATRDLALPVRKLIADGRIHAEGERRATRYFPGPGDGASSPRRRRGKRRS